MMRNPEQTIGSLIDRQKVALIGFLDGEGFPSVRAFLPPRLREGIRTFYFTTNTSSRHAAYCRQNPKTCLYLFDKRFYRGAMLRGTMEVLEDSESKELIWQPGDTLYYSGGVTDPDYCVMRFTAESGRYYSNFKSEDFEVSFF